MGEFSEWCWEISLWWRLRLLHPKIKKKTNVNVLPDWTWGNIRKSQASAATTKKLGSSKRRVPCVKKICFVFWEPRKIPETSYTSPTKQFIFATRTGRFKLKIPHSTQNNKTSRNFPAWHTVERRWFTPERTNTKCIRFKKHNQSPQNLRVLSHHSRSPCSQCTTLGSTIVVKSTTKNVSIDYVRSYTFRHHRKKTNS